MYTITATDNNIIKMTTSCRNQSLFVEKQTIIAGLDTINPRQVRELIRNNWVYISDKLDGGVILFIAGRHGTEDGKLGDQTDSVENMKLQV